MIRYALFAAAIAMCNDVWSARLYHESLYQEAWCQTEEGETEFWLPDGTRVDCLLAGTIDEPGYAIEFDFADKWAESIGQSLFYARMTDKQPGIVLILEDPTADMRYVTRLKTAIRMLCPRIRVWLISPREVVHEETSGFQICSTENCQ